VNHPIVIAGTGLAGYTLARELRKLDKATPVVMLSADDGGFYLKPMLSNAFASGKSPEQLLNSSAAAMAAQLGVEVRAYTHVSAINPAARQVITDKGALAYASLVLALGADPIRLPLIGDAAGEVMSVNDLADYARFRSAISGKNAGKKRVAILGAGLIGCEFANDLAIGGYAVDVIDIAPQPLGRLLPEAPAQKLRQALAAAGVRWQLGRRTSSIDRVGGALRVSFEDGGAIVADVVLSAVGLAPRTALARAAGLAANRGIAVDRHLRSSAPDIYALGDCAEVEGLVLPYVMPIMQAARALAATLAGSQQAVCYPAMPVMVKTPALATVVCPPPAGAAGIWASESAGPGTQSRFVGADGSLLGFALTGAAQSMKTRFAREIAPLLA
jgi:rubredoxin-NAD+ reductase